MVEPETDDSKWPEWTTLRRADPEARPTTEWTRHVNSFETEAERKALRHSLARGTPFGETEPRSRISQVELAFV